MSTGYGRLFRPLQGSKRAKTSARCYRVIPYTERYVSEDLPDLWTRLDSIYNLFQAYQRHYHQARWAECCLCFESMTHSGRLGHPASKTISIKELIDRENIYSQEELRRFMLKTLPHNEDGAILLPQVNMRHRTSEKNEDSVPQPPDDAVFAKRNQEKLDEPNEKVHHEQEERTQEQPCEEISSQKCEIPAVKVGNH